MERVYIEHCNGAKYSEGGYNPGKAYPEYLFGPSFLSREGNDAYDMVRNCLIGLELDKENLGKKQWNPLGQYVRPGDTVVIKPNLVMHKNENPNVENGLVCLITNPACIRAICDYCLIALKDSGKIVIGDAPMQGCNFPELMEKTGLPQIVQFYQEQGYRQVSIRDFREYSVVVNKRAVLLGKKYNDSQAIAVCMDEKSQHNGSSSNGQYQVSDYDIEDTKRFHSDGHHQYVVAKEVLEADLLINFCKPKTHRLAGFTGAMKNMVGITYNKACLPHRTRGSVSEGGDAYPNRSFWKRRADWALTEKIRQENKGHIFLATLLRYMYLGFRMAGNIFGKDPYFIGSWYGNDTIWRTVCDLNYIVKFADKEGKLHDTPQRKILCFGDMLIAGEGNGPVKPTPKPLGLMIASQDPIAFDLTLCKLMGFAPDAIPLIRNIAAGNTQFPAVDPDILWRENGMQHAQGPLSRMVFPKEWKFQPHNAWVHPEKTAGKQV